MTRAQLILGKFTHKEVVDGISAFVIKKLDDGDIEVMHMIVTQINMKGLIVIALTMSKSGEISLWEVPFKFQDLGTHENYVLQGCARVGKASQLPNRQTYLADGISQFEVNRRCLDDYNNIPDFEGNTRDLELESLLGGVPF